MKLRDNIKYDLIPFEAAGATWYMKPLTVKEVNELQNKFKGLEDNPDDLSPLLHLFTDVLVDEHGEQYEDVKDISFDELASILPVQAIHEISEAITNKLSYSGN